MMSKKGLTEEKCTFSIKSENHIPTLLGNLQQVGGAARKRSTCNIDQCIKGTKEFPSLFNSRMSLFLACDITDHGVNFAWEKRIHFFFEMLKGFRVNIGG